MIIGLFGHIPEDASVVHVGRGLLKRINLHFEGLEMDDNLVCRLRGVPEIRSMHTLLKLIALGNFLFVVKESRGV